MNKSFKKDFRLKDGTFIAKDTQAEVKMKPDSNVMAIAIVNGREIKVVARKLHKYFPGFVDPQKELEDMEDSSVSISLTGKRVEPDGYDDHGFPSILICLGLV